MGFFQLARGVFRFGAFFEGDAVGVGGLAAPLEGLLLGEGVGLFLGRGEGRAGD